MQVNSSVNLRRVLTYSFILLLFASCRGQTTKSDESANNENFNQSLPTLPYSELEIMMRGCTGIDYTFLDLGFSMSVDDPEEILDDFVIIGTGKPMIDPGCKPTAMIFYKKDLDRFYDAELYFSDKCKYIIFKKDGVRKYANMLSPEGVENFQAIFEFVEQQIRQKSGN